MRNTQGPLREGERHRKTEAELHRLKHREAREGETERHCDKASERQTGSEKCERSVREREGERERDRERVS